MVAITLSVTRADHHNGRLSTVDIQVRAPHPHTKLDLVWAAIPVIRSLHFETSWNVMAIRYVWGPTVWDLYDRDRCGWLPMIPKTHAEVRAVLIPCDPDVVVDANESEEEFKCARRVTAELECVKKEAESAKKEAESAKKEAESAKKEAESAKTQLRRVVEALKERDQVRDHRKKAGEQLATARLNLKEAESVFEHKQLVLASAVEELEEAEADLAEELKKLE